MGGWDGNKTEKDRKFLSDLKLLFTAYNDMPLNDLRDIVRDFVADLIETNVLMLDIREPNEIERAKQELNAKTILIRNKNIPPITSNMADANVENYTYDYIIENNGTLEELEEKAIEFISEVIV